MLDKLKPRHPHGRNQDPRPASAGGNRQRGRPCLRYKDLIKANLQHAKIQPKEIEAAASDIVRWRALSKIACKSFQEHRYQRFQEKREKRQSAAEAAPLQNTDRFSMPEVSKSACFRIGLHSHLRAHDKKE